MPTTQDAITAIVDRAHTLAATEDADGIFYAAKTLEVLGATSAVLEGLADINTAGTTQVAAVNSAGTTQVAAVNSAGAAQVATILASGGMDYSGLTVQTVSTLKTAQESCTITTADTEWGTGLSCTITPELNGSKIKITVRAFGEIASAQNVVANIHRNGTRINNGLNGDVTYSGLAMFSQTYGGGTDNNTTPEILSLVTLDTTGTTAGTPITYKLMLSSNGSNLDAWVNRCFFAPQSAQESGTSEIILEEIAA